MISLDKQIGSTQTGRRITWGCRLTEIPEDWADEAARWKRTRGRLKRAYYGEENKAA